MPRSHHLSSNRNCGTRGVGHFFVHRRFVDAIDTLNITSFAFLVVNYNCFAICGVSPRQRQKSQHVEHCLWS